MVVLLCCCVVWCVCCVVVWSYCVYVCVCLLCGGGALCCGTVWFGVGVSVCVGLLVVWCCCGVLS